MPFLYSNSKAAYTLEWQKFGFWESPCLEILAVTGKSDTLCAWKHITNGEKNDLLFRIQTINFPILFVSNLTTSKAAHSRMSFKLVPLTACK